MQIEEQARAALGDDLYAKLLKAIVRTRGTHRLEDVVHGIADGRMQILQSKLSLLVTEVIEYPTGVKAVNVFLAAGNLRDQHTVMITKLEEFARSIGADRIVSAARPGWAKKATEIGFKPTATIITKMLNEENAP